MKLFLNSLNECSGLWSGQVFFLLCVFSFLILRIRDTPVIFCDILWNFTFDGEPTKSATEEKGRHIIKKRTISFLSIISLALWMQDDPKSKELLSSLPWGNKETDQYFTEHWTIDGVWLPITLLIDTEVLIGAAVIFWERSYFFYSFILFILFYFFLTLKWPVRVYFWGKRRVHSRKVFIVDPYCILFVWHCNWLSFILVIISTLYQKE